jgi:hypothetical protein
LEDLGLPSAAATNGTVDAPDLRLTADGFQVTVRAPMTDGSMPRWHIREDARVWKE